MQADSVTTNAGAWLPFAVFWLVLLIVAGAEAARPLRARNSGADGAPPRLAHNFGYGILNLSMFVLVPVTSVTAAEWASRHGWGLLPYLDLRPWGAGALTLLIRSAAGYVIHRLSHRSSLLWRIHRVHHSDHEVDLSTGFRNHPLEALFVAASLGAVAIVLGLSPAALAIYEAIAVGFAIWTHADLRLPERVDSRLRWLIVTPQMHHVHHSCRRSEADSNYGDVLTIWDRLFGTYRNLDSEAVAALRVGLDDGWAGPTGFIAQLGSPFRPDRPLEAREEACHILSEGVDGVASLHGDQRRQSE